MARRVKWIIGQLVRIVALIIGIYLIIITFGMEPLVAIGEICKTQTGWGAIGETLLQVLKILFGAGYTFIGMAILYRWGTHLINKNCKKSK